MLLDLLGVESVAGSMNWVVVNVSAEDGLRVVWFYVLSATTVTVAAGTNFVIERAVYFVLLSS